MPGAPTPQSVNAMRVGAQSGTAAASLRYQWQQPRYKVDAHGVVSKNPAVSNEFPIIPVPKDTYEDVANIKSQYATSGAGDNWVIPFEQADAQYLMRKRDAEEKAAFDTWVTSRYNMADPAENLLLQRIAPELFTRREELINNMQETVSRYAKLRLRGPQSLDDLYLEWLVETNRLELPKGPIWAPDLWRDAQTGNANKPDDAAAIVKDTRWNQRRYYAGLFSPLKWLTTATSGWQANPNNRADIYGDPANRYDNDSVPLPGPSWANMWSRQAPYPYAGANAARDAGNNALPGATKNERRAAVAEAYP